MNTDLDKIVARVRKIMALAGNTPNEHERAVALEHAQNLLTKYNLTLYEVEQHQLADDVDGQLLESFAKETWATTLLFNVSKLYYTKMYLSEEQRNGRKIRRPVMIGTKANIAVTLDVADWLVKSIRKEASTRYPHAAPRRAFRFGAVAALAEKVRELLHTENYPPAAVGTGLIAVRNKLEQANEDWLAKQGIQLSAQKPRQTRLNVRAYSAGRDYAGKLNLNRQVAAGAARKRLSET